MEGEEDKDKEEEADEKKPLPEELEPPPEEPEPPPEEPEPPPEEPEPPPEEPPPPPPPPPPEEPLESVAEMASETVQGKSQSQIPSAQKSSLWKAVSQKSQKSLTGVAGIKNFKPFSKSTNDLENPQATEKGGSKRTRLTGEGGGIAIPGFGNFSCNTFLSKRSPFIHNPPQPEERRMRVQNPRTPREYIINLREDLADFQETHGLPRTRDYSFVSLGLALAQETARAFCSLVLMFAELFPIIAIVSLIVRFALDKVIEILETDEPVLKLKKSLIFVLQMLVIIIPLWILIGTIIIPLMSLIFSIFKRMVRFKTPGRRSSAKPRPKPKPKPKPCPTSSFDLLRFF